MLTERPWKIEAVLRYLLGLFTSIFCGGLLMSWLNSPYSPVKFDPEVVRVVVSTLSYHVMALVLTILLLREHDTDWASAFGFSEARLGRCLLLAMLVTVAVLPICLSLYDLSARAMMRLNLEPAAQHLVTTLQTAESPGLKILIAVLTVVVGPPAEEMIFRGVLYPAIKQQGFPRLALWGTSLLFAANHFHPASFLPLFFLAVILTLLYETTNNLLAPIVTHSLFNFANWLLAVTHSVGR